MVVLSTVAIVVRDYDEAIAYYCDKLGFMVREDVPLADKRWVVLESLDRQGAQLLLARAATTHQETRIGDQTGGRVFLFLRTDDFARDYAAFTARGVSFVRSPRDEPYGTVAVFADLYGNLWNLIGPPVNPRSDA